MIFETPNLDAAEEAVLARIREAWKRLAWLLPTEPYPWTGFLRQTSFARAIRGSNSIEGYEVTPDDALAAAEEDEPFEAGGEVWAAVTGYRDAMTYVLRLAKDPSFSYDASLLRSLHFMMLKHTAAKHPGQWRPGSIFVRDDHRGEVVYEGPDVRLVPELMDELVRWLRIDKQEHSPMVRAAMAHLNLVMIHPFSDGNGRAARCLQTLVLARAGVLDPVFCSIEEYLGRHTKEYESVLAEVGGGKWQPTRDVHPWIRLMLTAHHQQAQTFLRRQQEMSLVWEDVERLARERGVAERSVPALVSAAFRLRLRNSSYRRATGIESNQSASRELRVLTRAGLLIAKGAGRGRFYIAAPELLTLRENRHNREAIRDPFDEL